MDSLNGSGGGTTFDWFESADWQVKEMSSSHLIVSIIAVKNGLLTNQDLSDAEPFTETVTFFFFFSNSM